VRKYNVIALRSPNVSDVTTNASYVVWCVAAVCPRFKPPPNPPA
jgi:hypothetical protein